ncbi:type III secretion system stator protein SctL [Sandaracinus amylolyticus]|uniref:type III secretion system stator protein SctL n=1 Tax=Sandaracinus amylolyticus TaxID=927083 RepID=UPI001F00B142|nr:type III secretion system stator protein SctL [Sandaracinus amylolyticus]UJR79174.1 Flagellar assembly protein FliH [Sandaracinus amylolyticus]
MSRVIRGPGVPPRVVPAEVVDARAEAERIVEAARREAEALVEGARAECERLRAEARAEGAASGLAQAAALLVEARRARDGALVGIERDAQTLALAAAERIVGEALTIDPSRVITIVRDVIARARRARAIELRVHPEDARVLDGAIDAGVRVIEDASITRGGCVMRSELGTVDARVEVRIDAMARMLGCERP